MKVSKIRNMVVVLSATLAGSAFAAVSAEEAKQLGGPVLTLFGAEKAGNKDGTIPAYTGEQVKPPPGYDAKKTPGLRPDPFNEKPLFSITAQNAAQYASRLTDGTMQMFKQFPDFRIDVYPTHRTHTYPKYVLDNTVKNATGCKTANNGQAIEGCYGGVPFPIPKTGNEVMWNHLTKYETHVMNGSTSIWLVPQNGRPIMQDYQKNTQEFAFYDPKRTSQFAGTDVYWRARMDTVGPPRNNGNSFMLVDAVNTVRRAWSYIPGQRRVKLAPDLAYDTPAPGTGGVITLDEAKGFMGALDRFNWKLIGKVEKYIPYNTFNLGANKFCSVEKLTGTKHFVNPDCVRWELHRVWVVEATLNPQFRHIYKKRMFYWDEDNFGAGFFENYDASGALYKYGYSMSYPFFAPEYGGTESTGVYTNMQNGDLLILGGVALQDTDGYWPVPPESSLSFNPEALAGGGIR